MKRQVILIVLLLRSLVPLTTQVITKGEVAEPSGKHKLEEVLLHTSKSNIHIHAR